MPVTQTKFGTTPEGISVSCFRITNSMGCYAELLDYGGTLHALAVPDRDGRLTDVVLGYDTLEEYEQYSDYLGATVGRHANRIGGAQFQLNGQTYLLAKNNGENHLHGGNKGFDKQVWNHRILGEDSLCFFRTSPDGEEGYPGTLEVTVTFTFTRDCALDICYEARSDADTVVNLTNHSYFNLSGRGDIEGHTLQLLAERFTENDSACLPTGCVLDVEGTPMDFRTPKALGTELHTNWAQMKDLGGYDHNFVLSDSATLKKAAVLTAPDTGIVMTTYTTLPGIQLYTANALTPCKGKHTAHYKPFSGVCLETQLFPNALMHDNFPSPILLAGHIFRQQTSYQFSTQQEASY